MTFTRLALTALVAVGMPRMVVAQALPLGTEFRVNTYTTERQFAPQVATVPGTGDFIVAWSSFLQDGGASSSGVYSQRFDRSGAMVGTEFLVNTITTGSQAFPSVAADPSGDFFVAYRGEDGSLPGVMGQRFASSGSALGTEFQVNTYTTDVQAGVDIAVDPNGNYVVVWEGITSPLDIEVYGQRYDSTGAPVGTEMQIDEGAEPEVAVDAAGNFVVVYVNARDSYQYPIAARRFASTGAPLGPEFEISSNEYDVAAFTYGPDVATDGVGNFVVVWEREILGERSEIRVRRYDSAGMPQGTEYAISNPNGTSLAPAVAMSSTGDFVVAYHGCPEDESGECYPGLVGRRFGSSGGAIGPEFRLNDNVGTQGVPDIAFGTAGEFVVVWDSFVNYPEFEVFAKRFATTSTTPICTTGTIMVNTRVKLSKLGAPSGDEKFLIKGELAFAAGTPATFDPSTLGAQLLIEDSGSGNTAIFELSHLGQPILGGAGCTGDDKWKANGPGTVHKYKNKSGSMPPSCTAGSAKGLGLINLKDQRDKRSVIKFKVKAKNANIGAPVGPLRVTLVLGASASAGAAGECGAVTFAPAQCAADGTTFACQQ